MTLKRVDFPAPFPPRMVIKSPSLMVRLTWSRMVFSVSKPLLTLTVASLSSTIAVIVIRSPP